MGNHERVAVPASGSSPSCSSLQPTACETDLACPLPAMLASSILEPSAMNPCAIPSEVLAPVLSPCAFVPEPLIDQTWLLSVTERKIFWLRDSAIHRESFEFEPRVHSTAR